MTINVYAANWQWLFEDLKRHFTGGNGPLEWYDSTWGWKHHVTASDAPGPAADAWICLRTREAPLSPDPSRTVVMVHDMDRHSIFGYGGYVFTHPEQMQHCEYDVGRLTLMRPIGADDRLTLRSELPPKFTIGWVGRNTGPNKGISLLADACSRLAFDHKVLLLGAQLGPVALELSALPHCEVELIERQPEEPFDFALYQSAYHRMDVLAITSQSEAGPLCLFEALACGVPVVSTDCGWAKEMLAKIAAGPQEMADSLSDYMSHREPMLRRSVRIGHTLQSWVRDCLRLAEEVGCQQ